MNVIKVENHLIIKMDKIGRIGLIVTGNIWFIFWFIDNWIDPPHDPNLMLYLGIIFIPYIVMVSIGLFTDTNKNISTNENY